MTGAGAEASQSLCIPLMKKPDLNFKQRVLQNLFVDPPQTELSINDGISKASGEID
jgi:hypothetical protein